MAPRLLNNFEVSPRVRRAFYLFGAIGLVGAIGCAGLLFAHSASPKSTVPVIKAVTPLEDYQPATRLLKHGNRALKEIALTIDDGPHPKSMDKILEVLHEYDVPATFFLVGKRIREHPSYAQKILDGGHEVGNHTEDHYRLTTLSDDKARLQLEDCAKAFRESTGKEFYLMRPPGLRFNANVLKLTKQMNYVMVDYSNACKDFSTDREKLDGTPIDTLLDRVKARLGNGSIILVHDTVESAAILPQLILAMELDGYKFVTITEMLAHLPDPVIVPTNGKTRAPQAE